MNEECKAKH